MTIAIFGESCTGKSSLANELKEILSMTVYTGKDYTRLAKNEREAAALFADMLADPKQNIIFVISEEEHMAMLPKQGCVRILVTADISTIKERFAARTGGKLPPPIEKMLERKHGMFDSQACDIHIQSDKSSPIDNRIIIMNYLAKLGYKIID